MNWIQHNEGLNGTFINIYSSYVLDRYDLPAFILATDEGVYVSEDLATWKLIHDQTVNQFTYVDELKLFAGFLPNGNFTYSPVITIYIAEFLRRIQYFS